MILSFPIKKLFEHPVNFKMTNSLKKFLCKICTFDFTFHAHICHMSSSAWGHDFGKKKWKSTFEVKPFYRVSQQVWNNVLKLRNECERSEHCLRKLQKICILLHKIAFSAFFLALQKWKWLFKATFLHYLM